MDQALPQSLCESHTWKYYSLQDFFVEDILYLYLYKDIPYLRFVKCTVNASNALQIASRVPMNNNSRKGVLLHAGLVTTSNHHPLAAKSATTTPNSTETFHIVAELVNRSQSLAY